MKVSNSTQIQEKGKLAKIIEVKDVYKDFGEKQQTVQILKGINLDIYEGEFASIMGSSGCGKSTLLFLIGALDSPTSGEILINGVNMFSLSDREQSKQRRKNIGFVFQFYNLVPNLTVEENIMLPISMSGGNVKNYREKLDYLLEITELTERRKNIPGQLSGGQQQRVAIARAVITTPSIILADEPVGNLDSVTGERVMELFRDINQQFGITILQVTHDESKALYGNRIINLKDGKVLKESPLV